VIEYDYEIQRDEGDAIKKYTPNKKIGKKLPNLALIEAPLGLKIARVSLNRLLMI